MCILMKDTDVCTSKRARMCVLVKSHGCVNYLETIMCDLVKDMSVCASPGIGYA